MTDSTDQHGNRIIFTRLPLKVKAMVTRNEDGSHTIALNTAMSQETQRKEYIHELKHILKGHFDCLSLNQAESEAVE